MRRSLRSALVVLGASCVALAPKPALRAQQPPAAESRPTRAAAVAVDRIKEEGLKRSQVMMTLSYLTDVIGPRLTGSPNMKRANEWTRDRLSAWGLQNAHLEAWGPFGRGWSLKRFSAQVIEPQCIPIIAYPKAWSPGIEGTLIGPVVYFDAKSEADFARFKGRLKKAIVLNAPPREIAAHFEPLGTRKTDSELLALADAAEPEARGGRGTRQARGQNPGPARDGARPGQAAPGGPEAARNAAPRGRFQGDPEQRRIQAELAARRLKFLLDEGAGVLVDPSSRGDGGTLFVQSASVPGPTPGPGPGGGPGRGQGQAPARRVSAYDRDAPRILPQIVMASEHYNRLIRMLEQGVRPMMAINLSVQFHDEDPMAYNTVAEIPGTDPKLRDEVVMLGGHMDSWHSGTGATDNAAGVSVAMEAVRILQALDLKPRRTIRIALWSGEEEGLLGSRAYVTKHFGLSPAGMGGGRPASSNGNASDGAHPSPTPEFAGFQAYFNLDNGTGKIRGVYLQGNEAVRPIFRKWLQPFREMGASTLTLSNTGSTDHVSFDGIGLPGFQFIQDEIEYGTRTHHSNQDVYDRIQAEDMKQASVIMASFVYNAATMDEKLPRKPAPAPAAGRRGLANN